MQSDGAPGHPVHSGEDRDDWFDLIVGNAGSNVGMLRILAAILVFILVFGGLSWLIA